MDTQILQGLAIYEADAAIAPLADALSRIQAYRTRLSSSGDWPGALGILAERPEINLIFLDHALRGPAGFDAIKVIRETGDARPIIVLIPADDQAIAMRMIREGADDYVITDSLDPFQLERAIRNGMERHRMRAEKALLEKEVRQAQKMESLGALAGGIAHDFNNILMPILGYSEMAVELIPTTSKLHEYMREIVLAARQARDLVQQILTFSRQDDRTRQPVRIQSIIKEAFKLLRASVPHAISMHQFIDPDCRPVMADLSQIYQVVMNLATNACQAITDVDGLITFRLSEIVADEEKRKALGLPGPGAYNLFSVSDTGCGIPEHLKQRIFEPFFTTKPKGTGMGLSVVQGIVKSHGGVLSVESQEGKGCTFHIYLPVAAEAPAADPGPPGASAEPASGREHVMLVDDEETVSRVNYHMLSGMGYTPTGFTSSPEATLFFTENPDSFDLIITDMSMPVMSGLTLSRAILELNPRVPVILYTGYPDPLVEKTARQIGIREVIVKPLIRRDLARIIREILDDRSRISYGTPAESMA